MITIFEKYNNKPDVNSVSSEFWKMIEIADWNSVIKYYQGIRFSAKVYVNLFEKAQLELYKNHTLGWKLSGAGGGGYLIFFSENKIENAIQIRIRRG